MKAIQITLVFLFLAMLLSGSPVLASEPVEPEARQPEQPSYTLPAGYAVRSVGDMQVTIVDTPPGTSGLVDAFVVLAVAKEMSERGEAGLVIGCVPVKGAAGVCGGTYFALSTPVTIPVPVQMPDDIQMVSAKSK